MAKAETLKALGVNRMPISVQIMAGRLFDAGHELGCKEGFEKGVRKGAESAIDKLEEAYDKGAKDANATSSAAFLACASIALHELYGFAAIRCQRVVDRTAELMLKTLHPSEWVDECAKIGVVIDAVDVLKELYEEYDRKEALNRV